MFYVEGDGTGIPVRPEETEGRKGKQDDQPAKTREVKLGCVFTQTKEDEEGKPVRDPESTSYVATLEPAAEFGALLRAEAFQRGLALAKLVVFLGDGAAWVWELARVNFPMAVFILDFFHAAEHLEWLAEALFGEKTDAVQNPVGTMGQGAQGATRRLGDRPAGGAPGTASPGQAARGRPQTDRLL